MKEWLKGKNFSLKFNRKNEFLKDTTGADSHRFEQPPDLAPIKKKLARTISLKHFLPRPNFENFIKFGFSDFDYSPNYNLVRKRAPEISFNKNSLKRLDQLSTKKFVPVLSHVDLENYWEKYDNKTKSVDLGKSLGRKEQRICQREVIPFLEPDIFQQQQEGKPEKIFWYKKKDKLLKTPLEDIFKDNLKLLK